MELSPFNVRVMLVAPGGVSTSINRSVNGLTLPPSSVYTDYFDAILERLRTVDKGMDPADFAKPVVASALKSNPPFFVSLASSATLFKIFSWLPTRVVRYILCKALIKRNRNK
jgi:1-acylglycerone phosphate reductase